MDYEQRVRRASGGDVKAFVDLTRQFQHMAFGAALAVVNDFHQAEDIVQEAFVAAWSALPSLADLAASSRQAPQHRPASGVDLGASTAGDCRPMVCRRPLQIPRR
jgi:hypothetical protein